jgi:SAM-dependent methyltransferase
MKCRFCGAALSGPFLDLGFTPPSNAYLTAQQLHEPELYFPLRVRVCGACWLVQTEDYARADELFREDYAYFSSVSATWLKHAATYCTMIASRLQLGPKSLVVEVASNDGYLLRNFVARGIPCLGIEPTESTAAAAEAIGVPVLRAFFGAERAATLRAERGPVDLLIGNNVFAHVPDINDFTAGIERALAPEGSVTLEFPHLYRLLHDVQFDTIYHEHFSYLSLSVVSRIFARHGLRVYDVEELPTHGGSLRVYGCKVDAAHETRPSVRRILELEVAYGLESCDPYEQLSVRAETVKDAMLAFLLEQKRAGKRVMAYGAAAKGNTLLNYAGVKPDLLSAVFDAAPSKQGRYLPGSHVPILNPDRIPAMRPDFLLVLPWNLIDEVVTQQAQIRGWGGQFVRVIPTLEIVP